MATYRGVQPTRLPHYRPWQQRQVLPGNTQWLQAEALIEYQRCVIHKKQPSKRHFSPHASPTLIPDSTALW